MHKRFLITGTLILAILILSFPFPWGHPILAKEALLQEPDQLFGFAMHLYQGGDWYRAITEFKKFMFLNPRDPRTKDAYYLIGISYKKGGKWDRAIRQFRQCSLRFPDDPIARKAIFQIGETYYESGRYHPALSAYQEVIRTHPNSEEARTARYKKGWVYLQLNQYEKAIEILDAIDSQSPYHDQSSKLVEKLQKTASSLPQKSPSLAGVLSGVIPGTGHIYSGEFKNGVVSFLLNALFITGAVTAFRNDLNVTGGILSFLDLGWYFGGISSAVEAAKKSNKRTRRGYLDSLNQTSFHVIQEEGEVVLVVRISF